MVMKANDHHESNFNKSEEKIWECLTDPKDPSIFIGPLVPLLGINGKKSQKLEINDA